MNKLKFSPANTKLQKLQKRIKKQVYSLDLVAGKSCPFAKSCKSCVVDGKIKDGKNTKWRCYAASLEALYPTVYLNHLHNFRLIQGCKSVKQIVDLLSRSLPENAEVIRIHSSGDFFKRSYLYALIQFAYKNPQIIFYGHTKSTKYIADIIHTLPSNLRLTMSIGGTHDHLIDEYNLRSSTVVGKNFTSKQISADNDDYLAYQGKVSFVLPVHGTQKKSNLKKLDSSSQ